MSRYIRLITLALAFGITVTACKYSYKQETINVNNKFSMTVPDYLSPAKDLKPGAEFQYSNRFRNFYVVVFSDPKDADFNTYYQRQSAIIKNVLNKPSVLDSLPYQINGAKGVHTEIAGQMNGEMIYYSLLTLESADRYYQACIWTRGEDRKLKYGADIQKVLTSFKLL